MFCIRVISSSVVSSTKCSTRDFYIGRGNATGGGAEIFVLHHYSFHCGKYASSETNIAHMHQRLGDDSSRPALTEHDSMPYYPI